MPMKFPLYGHGIQKKIKIDNNFSSLPPNLFSEAWRAGWGTQQGSPSTSGKGPRIKAIKGRGVKGAPRSP